MVFGVSFIDYIWIFIAREFGLVSHLSIKVFTLYSLDFNESLFYLRSFLNLLSFLILI